jgi:hypothetical protein
MSCFLRAEYIIQYYDNAQSVMHHKRANLTPPGWHMAGTGMTGQKYQR